MVDSKEFPVGGKNSHKLFFWTSAKDFFADGWSHDDVTRDFHFFKATPPPTIKFGTIEKFFVLLPIEPDTIIAQIIFFRKTSIQICFNRLFSLSPLNFEKPAGIRSVAIEAAGNEFRPPSLQESLLDFFSIKFWFLAQSFESDVSSNLPVIRINENLSFSLLHTHSQKESVSVHVCVSYTLTQGDIRWHTLTRFHSERERESHSHSMTALREAMSFR